MRLLLVGLLIAGGIGASVLLHLQGGRIATRLGAI